jgi:hypothetical protein
MYLHIFFSFLSFNKIFELKMLHISSPALISYLIQSNPLYFFLSFTHSSTYLNPSLHPNLLSSHHYTSLSTIPILVANRTQKRLIYPPMHFLPHGTQEILSIHKHVVCIRCEIRWSMDDPFRRRLMAFCLARGYEFVA